MDPMKGAQDVIRCYVCSDKEREKSPAEVRCNTCHINVCSPCVARHMALDRSKKHDIVLLHVSDTEIVLPTCSKHTQLKCDLHCKKCSIPICLKCLSSDHNSHIVEEVAELCQKICKDIQNETKELQQSIIPEFEKISVDETENLTKLNEAYDKLESSVETHGKDLQKSMDAVVAKYRTQIQGKRQTDIKIIQQQMNEINGKISGAKQAAVKNEELLRTKNALSLIAHKSENTNLSKVPSLRIVIPPKFKPKPIPTDLLESVFGEIEDSQILVKQGITVQKKDGQASAPIVPTDKVVYTFSTPYKRLLRIACTQSGQLWTSGSENTLRCLDKTSGSVVDTMTIALNPTAICMTEEGELLVTNGTDVYVRQMSGGLALYYRVNQGWSAEAMASSTESGELLMFLRREDNRQSKVVRIVRGVARIEYQQDDNGKELFNSNCFDFFLAQNRNGDICVCDTSALTVLDKSGKFRFRYHGKVFETFDKPFKPRGVSTDSRGNILLADLDNRCIHLVDKDGGLIRYITCGGSLDRVYDVCCDKEGRVWVAERDTAKVKCIQYQESTS